MSKLFLGVGINDADYVVQIKETVGYVDGKQKRKIIWTCPFYQKWASMLSRCYSPRVQKLQPSYGGVTVCEGWLTFSNFKSWMEKQDWEGKELDKDILFPNCKIYSPITCAFVPKKINLLLGTRVKRRGEYPLGVHKRKPGKDMVNDYSKPFVSEGFIDGKRKLLGVFASASEAHAAWQISKIAAIRQTVLEWQDEDTYHPRVAESLLRIAAKVEVEYIIGQETVGYG